MWADALPVGTVIWSNPGNGSGVYTIVPAVPSPDGVADVFAVQSDGTVQAITSDGATAWTADVSLAYGALADFQGGLLTTESDGTAYSVVRINGTSGQRTVLYSVDYEETEYEYVCAVGAHTDGTVFVLRCADGMDGQGAVIGIDPDTAAQKFSVPVGGTAYAGRQGTGVGGSNLIIAGDGYAYVPYAYQEPVPGTPQQNHLRLLRIDSSGVYNDIAIYDYATTYLETFIAAGVYTITNADTGILLSWTVYLTGEQIAHGMVVVFDQSGSITGLLASLPVQSSTGNEHLSSATVGSVQSVVEPAIFEDRASFGATSGGNPSGNGTAIAACPCLLQATPMTGTERSTARTAWTAPSSSMVRSTVSSGAPKRSNLSGGWHFRWRGLEMRRVTGTC